MSGERGKGPGDSEEGDPEEQEPAPDDPGFAGTDWLLSQLDEPVETDDADAADPEMAGPQSAIGGSTEEQESLHRPAEEPGDEDEGPLLFRSTFTPTTPIALPGPVEPSEAPAVPVEDHSAKPTETTEPAPRMRWSWTTGTVESITPADADAAAPPISEATRLPADRPEAVTPPAASADYFEEVEPGTGYVPQHAAGGTREPVSDDAQGNDEEPSGFFWGLTPGGGVDPLVHPEAGLTAASEPADEHQPMTRAERKRAEEAAAQAAVFGADGLTASPAPGGPAGAASVVAARGAAQFPLADDADDAEEPPETAALPHGRPSVPTTAATEIFQTPLSNESAESPASAEDDPLLDEAAYQPTSAAAAAATAKIESVVPPGAAAPAESAARGGASAVPSRRSTGAGSGPRPPRSSRERRTTRILIIAAAVLLLILVLIGLYVFGRQLPGMVGAASTPVVTASPLTTKSPTPTPSVTVAASGPVAPGTHSWDALRGGECLQPFSTPWAQTFTVVDCASPHAAQMVYTNVFSADPKAAYPGAQQLASQINLLCTKPGILNLDAAGQLSDAQMQGTYPATQQQWKAGQRSYFCFVNRASGQPITGSLAGPGPTG